MPPNIIAIVPALMFLASVASATPKVYKAACTGAQVVPPVSTGATGQVSITIVNASYGTGYFYATNINQMTMAHIHAGAVGQNGPIIAWAFNGTYGPVSGSIKSSFTFNPSANNISALLTLGLAYFNIHTVAYPAGELRGQLPFDYDPQACNLTARQPAYPSPLPYKGLSITYPDGSAVRDTFNSMKCFNSIGINRTLAIQHISSLAAYFQEYYVFNDIARNPADPSATPHAPFPPNLNVSLYRGKQDLQAGFQALIQSFDPTINTVPFGDLYFGINKVVTGGSLLDNHVNNGLTTSFGGVLDATSAFLTFFQIGDTSSGQVSFIPSRNGAFTDLITNKTIASINGSLPMDFISYLAGRQVWGSLDKTIGANINEILKSVYDSKSMKLALTYVPHIEDFHGQFYKVTYNDGTSSTWYPIVYFPSKSPFAKPDVNKVAQLSALASTPGPGYDALMSAINKYVGANLTSVPPITGYNASDQGPSKRRSMQNSASGLPYCQDLPGVPCGIMFNIRNRSDGSKYAVLKMTTFTNVDFSSHILPAWSTLVKWAVGNKTDSLIIDLLGNGGGAVKAAYSFALALFSPDQNASYPFINQNDRRVGPAAQYFLNNDLNLDNINRTLQTLLSNRTWVSNRVAALNTSTDILYSLLSSTTAMINAVSILINDNANAAPCVSPDGAAYAGQSCSLFWKYKNFPQLNSLYDNFENSTRVDEELLTAFIVGLVEAAAPFLPFNDDAKVGPAGESTKLFNTSTFHSLTRGGVNGVYTQPYYAFTFQGLYRDNNFSSLPQSPFKKIIAITDGRCGSSCDTFSRTAWFAARNKATPTAPSFKYYTFGGTGKMQDIAPTSFQGGNVLGMDSLSPAWAFYGLAYQAAVWLGDESILSLIDKIPAVLPFYPALLGTMGLPSVTQSEVYYSGLYGSGNPQSTIPGEYLLFQPDFYDPSLYLDVGVASASNPKGGSDLPDLYEAASQKF